MIISLKELHLSDDLLGEVPASSGSSTGGAGSSGGVYNATAPSDTGTRSTFVTNKKTPKYYDIFNAQKLAIGKTPCQPVYPDIVSVYNQVPEWALGRTLDKTTADNKEVKDATEVKSVSLKDGKTGFESLSTDKVTFGKMVDGFASKVKSTFGMVFEKYLRLLTISNTVRLIIIVKGI